MKIKAILAGLLTAALFTVGTVGALADDGVKWTVTYDGTGLVSSDFDENALNESLKNMQPGDEQVFSVTLKNNFSKSTDWYMSNIVGALEDSVTASGGAYTYVLEYKAPGASDYTAIYSSDTVGGTSTEEQALKGLSQATSAVSNGIYLFTMAPNTTGYVRLKVGLDGETLGNVYFDAEAPIVLKFGTLQTEALVSATPTPAPTAKPGQSPTPTQVPGVTATPTPKPHHSSDDDDDDDEAPTPAPAAPVAISQPAPPLTADTNDPALFASVMVISLTAFAICLKKAKQNKGGRS